jgi:hypothetical protein
VTIDWKSSLIWTILSAVGVALFGFIGYTITGHWIFL